MAVCHTWQIFDCGTINAVYRRNCGALLEQHELFSRVAERARVIEAIRKRQEWKPDVADFATSVGRHALALKPAVRSSPAVSWPSD